MADEKKIIDPKNKENESKAEDKIIYDKGKLIINGIKPMLIFLVIILLVAIFSNEISQVIYGKSFEAGVINDNTISKKLSNIFYGSEFDEKVSVIRFWTPMPNITLESTTLADSSNKMNTSSVIINGTHSSLDKFYKEESCSTEHSNTHRYQIDCKKTKTRLLNGYYLVSKNQIAALEHEIIDLGAVGFNRFITHGASTDTPTKSGYWWETTFPKKIEITQISKIVNKAFQRGKEEEVSKINPECIWNRKYMLESSKQSIIEGKSDFISKCQNQFRMPYISVYVEITR